MNFLYKNTCVLFVIGASFAIVTASSLYKGQFRISIEKRGNEVTMKCEKGCSWGEVSFTCLESKVCKRKVDSTGVYLASSSSPKKGFQFLVKLTEDKRKGIMICNYGCAWKKNTWNCSECTVRVDKLGVRSERP